MLDTAKPALPPIAFAGARIDRADHVRAHPDALEALRARGGRLLHLEGLDPVLSQDGLLTWGSLAGISTASVASRKCLPSSRARR